MVVVNFLTIYPLLLSIIGSVVLLEAQAFPFPFKRRSTPWNLTPDNWDIAKTPKILDLNFQVKQFSNLTDTAVKEFSDQLKLLMEQYSGPIIQDRTFDPTFRSSLFNWVCIGCSMAVGSARLLPNSWALGAIEFFCKFFGIQKKHVCEGLINLFGEELLYVLNNSDNSAKEFCSFYLGVDKCGDSYDSNHKWELMLSSVPKPQFPSEFPIPEEGAPFLKVLHLSDYHFDPYYEEGSNADCGDPLCCRESSGKPENIDAAAGKWGDFRKCDTPTRTVYSMLNHIAKTHKDIDYILWTGDLPPHDIWNQSKSSNLDIIKETVKQMTEKFPGVPIFPAVGNHETAPTNSFMPPNIGPPDMSTAYLYNELDTQWKRWLPESASETIRRGAFYSVLLRPGFRIISLNMNYCYNLNVWLFLNSTDPGAELQWFINELQNAERLNEKVHVIGHIPPGNTDCLKYWSQNFYKIIARFEDTIVAQFYGHTHFDEFEVFYDPNNWTHPTSIAYIGPSVSPYENLNPGYRIYYIDGDHNATTRLVIDHETWIIDLKKANAQNVDDPTWYKLYNAREAYNMKALRPSDWSEFIRKLSNDKEVFERYHKYYWQDSPMRPSCDEKCRKKIICDCKSGRSHDRKQLCKE